MFPFSHADGWPDWDTKPIQCSATVQFKIKSTKYNIEVTSLLPKVYLRKPVVRVFGGYSEVLPQTKLLSFHITQANFKYLRSFYRSVLLQVKNCYRHFYLTRRGSRGSKC